MASHCPGCTVTAPDTLDADGDIEAGIGQFLRTARPYPRIWPFNLYISVSTDNPRPIRRLLDDVHGQVWFSEVGGIVWWRFHGRLIYNGEANAVKVTKNIFRLASLSPRITRVYYYHWRSPGRRGRRRRRPGTRGRSPRTAWRGRRCSSSRRRCIGRFRRRGLARFEGQSRVDLEHIHPASSEKSAANSELTGC